MHYIDIITWGIYLIGIPLLYNYTGLAGAVAAALVVAYLSSRTPFTLREQRAEKRPENASILIGRAIGALLMSVPATLIWWYFAFMPASTAWLFAFGTCFAGLEIRYQWNIRALKQTV